MDRFAYRVHLEPADEGGFVVTFPDFDWGITQGEDRADALAQAQDALDEMVASLINRGEDIPSPAPGRAVRVHLGAQVAAKALLYLAMRETGVSNVELARRLDVDEREVRRMLDPRHSTKLTRVEQGLKALGKRLVLQAA